MPTDPTMLQLYRENALYIFCTLLKKILKKLFDFLLIGIGLNCTKLFWSIIPYEPFENPLKKLLNGVFI